MGDRLYPEVNVALQGTLDTFALPDVLRLLAATQKTGRLRLTGPRGTGSISVDSGTIGLIEASSAPFAVEPVDALFELLRFEQGSFTFDAESELSGDPHPGIADLEALLVEAESLLVEWQGIESVVPSMDAWVTLCSSPLTAPVSLDSDLWQTVVAIAGGAMVRQIADTRALPELPASRAVRGLVDLGLADVVADPPPGSVPVRPTRRSEPLVAAVEPFTPAEPERFVPLDLPQRGPAPTEATRIDEVAANGKHEPIDVADLMAAFPGLDTSARDQPAPTPEIDHQSEADAEEVARQLARLSPRAAEAVRSAAKGKTDREPVAAPESKTAEDEEPIDRGSLLKFLSSVKD